MVSVPEEIAFENSWIDKGKLAQAAKTYGKSPYGQHLQKVVDGRIVESPRD